MGRIEDVDFASTYYMLVYQAILDSKKVLDNSTIRNGSYEKSLRQEPKTSAQFTLTVLSL